MAITPQLIKDQEFEQKFRGCDPLEVRDYLEVVANEFFELQEQCAEQFEELETLREAKENSEKYTGSLETDMEFTRKVSDELKDSCTQKEEKLKNLTREVEELQLSLADTKQEDTEHDEEVSSMEAMIEEVEEALKESEKERNILTSKIEILKEQNEEIRKDEVNFKSTLASAQLFAEDLKEKSKIEAEEMISTAHAEIEKIRGDAQEELERLPREIEVLQKKKSAVKVDLKATLEGYMETIDVFVLDDEGTSGKQATVETTDTDGSSELFQSIEINEDGSLNPEDVARLNDDSGDAPSSSDIDEKVLDSLLKGDDGKVIDVDYDLKELFSLENKEEEK
jgi:cell division septum initiation protein DivIVA